MKLRLILFSSILLLTLSSCTPKSNDATSIAEQLRNVSSANYIANITAVFPSREAKFTLGYTYSKDGDDHISVISPIEVAGVSLTLSKDGAQLEFDGTRLETGTLNSDGLSPFSAIPALISSWKDGNFSETSNSRMFGKEAILAISRTEAASGGCEYRTWFSKDETVPLYAEIFSNGERVIQCQFERAEHNPQ